MGEYRMEMLGQNGDAVLVDPLMLCQVVPTGGERLTWRLSSVQLYL
jgi:hypothetical protein